MTSAEKTEGSKKRRKTDDADVLFDKSLSRESAAALTSTTHDDNDTFANFLLMARRSQMADI
jgi:hypothetical protein